MTTSPCRPAGPSTLIHLGLPGDPDGRIPHGSRSAMTCQYRCGNACDQPVPNRTEHPEFKDIAQRAIARRSVLLAGVGAVTVAAGTPSLAAAATGQPLHPAARPGPRHRSGAGTWSFDAVAPNRADHVRVPDGFRADLLIAWGDPVTKDAVPFDPRRQSAAAARTQFGYNNDYVGVLPHPTRHDRAVLVVNHEYTDEPLMFPAGTHNDDQVLKVAIANHGMSVVELDRGPRRGEWSVAPRRSTRLNRRIHDRTVFLLDGPAAGDRRLRTADDPTGHRVRGTFNNCAGGLTPWGTVLSGEENFNQYFDASSEIPESRRAAWARYGITGKGRRWSSVDERFDLSLHPNEVNRFGWVVEIDPSDPRTTPRKHTMLGRFKHEGANVTIADDGRVVVYSGDDERGDYVYRFISRGRFDPRPGARARRNNLELLTAGTLYVARFSDAPGRSSRDTQEHDGTGAWIPLTDERRSYVPGFTVAEVLIHTRLAADVVQPTRMDRPEDVEVNPVNGNLYMALTNNSARGTTFPVDAANPVGTSWVRAELGAPLKQASGNRNGYVMEITPDRGDHTRTRFTWDLVLVCGDPSAPETWFAGYPKQLVSPISCPDNLAFDAEGNLWISTDGNALGSNDGLFRMPVDGPRRGHLQQFLTVPRGAETCGPFIADDQQSVFVAVQHPGETDGASFDNPSSTWPHTGAFPRPAIVVVRRT